MDRQQYVPVTTAKGERIRNLFVRGEVFYVRVMQAGKWYIRALPQSSQVEAAREARRFVKSVRENRWEDVERCRTRQEQPWATLEQVCAAYLEAAALRGHPRPRVAHNNVLALRKVVELGRGVASGASTLGLTDDLVGAFAKAFLEDCEDGERDSRMRSVVSYLRQARSVFAAMGDFKGMRLPDLTTFREADPVRAPRWRYRMPAPEMYVPTIEAARALRGVRDDLYAAWLLVYDLGMRAGEAAAARWGWIELGRRMGHGTEAWMRVCNRPDEDFKVKGREGWIPIPPVVLGHLQGIRRADDPYILPGGHKTGRADLLNDTFSGWMRERGWETQKTAHELRKLKGCFWRGRYGLDLTHEWLRHSNYQTTLDYYADMPTRDEPLTLDV